MCLTHLLPCLLTRWTSCNAQTRPRLLGDQDWNSAMQDRGLRVLFCWSDCLYPAWLTCCFAPDSLMCSFQTVYQHCDPLLTGPLTGCLTAADCLLHDRCDDGLCAVGHLNQSCTTAGVYASSFPPNQQLQLCMSKS